MIIRETQKKSLFLCFKLEVRETLKKSLKIWYNIYDGDTSEFKSYKGTLKS